MEVTVTRLTVHLIWITKYRYPVIPGEVQKRCRELLIQVSDAEDVKILKGVLSKDDIYMHVEYPPMLGVSDLVKRLKGRSSRILQLEFPHLKKQYWGKHFWGIGYGAWNTGNITDKMVNDDLDHHKGRGRRVRVGVGP
jgi:putative transposase